MEAAPVASPAVPEPAASPAAAVDGPPSPPLPPSEPTPAKTASPTPVSSDGVAGQAVEVAEGEAVTESVPDVFAAPLVPLPTPPLFPAVVDRVAPIVAALHDADTLVRVAGPSSILPAFLRVISHACRDDGSFPGGVHVVESVSDEEALARAVGAEGTVKAWAHALPALTLLCVCVDEAGEPAWIATLHPIAASSPLRVIIASFPPDTLPKEVAASDVVIVAESASAPIPLPLFLSAMQAVTIPADLVTAFTEGLAGASEAPLNDALGVMKAAGFAHHQRRRVKAELEAPGTFDPSAMLTP